MSTEAAALCSTTSWQTGGPIIPPNQFTYVLP